MDHDAGQNSNDEYRHRPVLTKRISKAVLEALVAIKSVNAIHTGELARILCVFFVADLP